MIRIVPVLILLSAAACSTRGKAHPTDTIGPVGIQLYSLRDQFKADGVEATLDRVKALGITQVELAGTYGLEPETFKAMLDARGLDPVSGHFPYARWKDDPESIAVEAKALGLRYAGCAWAGHKAPFDERQCRETIAVFNRAGAVMARAGIRFFYHLHGFEFQPHAGSTLADLLILETDAATVSFQMDMLWIIFPGHDPVALLERYPDRWVSTHLKDLRKGVKTGILTGKTDVRNDVTLGAGQADWPAILRACRKAGVKHHFIEDESPDVLKQVPASLRYLKSLRF